MYIAGEKTASDLLFPITDVTCIREHRELTIMLSLATPLLL